MPSAQVTVKHFPDRSCPHFCRWLPGSAALCSAPVTCSVVTGQTLQTLEVLQQPPSFDHMVRLAAPVAINSRLAATEAQAGETAESQEERIHTDYQEALRLQHAGDTANAQMLFEQLLAEPALQINSSGHATNFALAAQVRFLILKNLATTLATEDSSSEQALRLYIQAAELDSTDTVLWHRMGTLATELGEWSIARHAFESGLRCSPQHCVIQNKLLEVLLKLDDWQSIPFVVELMLRQIPENVRAVRVHAAVQKQLQPVQLTQSDTVSASHLEHVSDLDQLQPQLKRRRSPAVDSIMQQIPLEHHITVPTLTWQALTKSLSQFMKHAVSTGLPGGCKVVFLWPDTDSQVCDTDMVSSPPAADQAATGSLLESENPGDAADPEVSQRLQQGDEQESRPKAAAVPVAAPQRASRRLGFSRATTEAASDHESPEPSKNVMELLAPFLVPQPQDVDSPSHVQASATISAADADSSSSQSPAEEEHYAVRQFLDQHKENSGLYAVAAALISRVLLSNGTSLQLPGLAQEVMDLEACVRGWPCSPAVALALAEIYFHAVVQQQKAEPDCKQSKPASCPSKHDQLLHSCTLNVGVFEAVLLQQQSSLSANTASDLFEAPAADNDQLSFVPQDGSTARSGAGSVNQPALPELLVRYHWLGACVSEHLKHFVDAAQHYRACKAALSALPQSSDNATVVRSALAGASSSICTELLERRLEALRLVSIVEDGRKCLDEGMHEELVSRLAPVLLADTVSTPLDLPQQLVGLGLLQEAAIGADAWQMHLQCLLARASLQLPPPPLTSQKNQCQLHHVPTHANLAVLDTLDDALAEHLPDWKKWLQAPDFSQAEPLGRLLAKMQWQVLGMVKALYASLAGNSSANSPTRRRLDVKEQHQQTGLLHAFQLLLTLRQLDSRLSWDRDSQLQLLNIGASLHSDAGTLVLAHGKYLKTCLVLLAPFFADVAQSSQPDLDPAASDSEVDVIGATAQCVYLLYGLEVSERNEAFTDGFQGKADSQVPQSHEEAICLWNYVLHFCRSVTNKSKSFKQRLQELLTAIREQTPPPPNSVLAQFCLDALLDAAESAQPSPAAALAAAPAVQPAAASLASGNDNMQIAGPSGSACSVDWPALKQAVKQDSDANLHSNLYHLLAQCQPDMSISEEDMMSQQGHEQIWDYLQITRVDLCYNPKRYESWERVLNTYITAAGSLANIVANHVELAMTAEQWQEASELQQRFRLYSLRALAAIQHAQLAAADIADPKERSSTLAFLEEQKGTLYLEQLQDAPPMYDQMKRQPDRASSNYQQACIAGLEAFQSAQQHLDEEWTFQLYIGKILRKLRRDNRPVLRHFAQACLWAQQTVGGSVESCYQLHSMRLKLLQEEQPDLGLLRKHCFLSETHAQLVMASTGTQQLVQPSSALTALSASGASNPLSNHQRVDLIYQDAMCAMDFCLEQSKQHSRNGAHETFHKARYRRAQALRWKGQPEQALAELQPLFKDKSRHGFAIKMYLIPDGVKKATKAYAASDSLAPEDLTDQSMAAVPEEQWGQKPLSLANNGVEESPRKFRAHVRRALMLYILLLKEAGDVSALRGVVITLRSTSFASYSDVGRWAFGLCLVHLAAALQLLKQPSPAQSRAASPPLDSSTCLTAAFQPPANQANSQQAAVTCAQLPAVTVDSADADLLESAYQLYQDIWWSEDPQHSWADLVDQGLTSVVRSQEPDIRHLLSCNAIGPDIFHKYALAYIHSLGCSAATDKLAGIHDKLKKQLTKRQMRKTSASVEACQSLYAAATAELQAACGRELKALEALASRMLHCCGQQPADAGGDPAIATQEQTTAAHPPAIEVLPSTQPAPVNILDREEEPAPHGAVQSEPMSAIEAGPSNSAVDEASHKQCRQQLLLLLQKCHAAWKALGAKGVEAALQGPVHSADLAQSSDLLSRAYTTYLRLSYPGQTFALVEASAAATGVDSLMQQAKSGVDTPKPVLPQTDAKQAEIVPISCT